MQIDTLAQHLQPLTADPANPLALAQGGAIVQQAKAVVAQLEDNLDLTSGVLRLDELETN